MVKTVFAAKGKSKSAEVVCVSQDDLTFLPQRRKFCYVTTSEGKLFTCPYEDTCVREAKSETENE